MPATNIRVLAVIPPMTQLNTPYPSTAYLTGFLRSRGVDAVQEDIALQLVLELFSPAGLRAMHAKVLALPAKKRTPSLHCFVDNFERYLASVTPAVAFLQGRDPSIGHRICGRQFLPEGPRFASLDNYIDDEGGDPLAWAFGSLGVQDRARHLATLYLDDLADVLRDAVDSRFEFVRYAESLARSQPTFEPLARALAAPKTLVDATLEKLTLAAVDRHSPGLVLVSVPFPGSVYAAFRMAQAIKAQHPDIVVALGGGWVNTELRELKEARVFDYFDYVTLDDGEQPIIALLEHLAGKRPRLNLVRTFTRVDGQVRYFTTGEPDVPFAEVGTPTWDGLPLDRYLSLLDMLNPMHRLWSDGRWNKLTVAHGCYWKKCSFCDVGLDYIGRYDGIAATTLVDRIETIIDETGQSGFHFVDEAAPPKALKAMAEELQKRNRAISWWGNIRFEKSFTPELCNQLADSGCIAVSGGLEVASDRLLKLMKKGVSVDQVARVTRAFSESGILVHAYLMYGFPTQTVQDTVDALEYVRQLFAEGCIQSGFFHRFACTVHSPVGLNPAEYGIKLKALPPITFATNDVEFFDPTGVDHDSLGRALNKALYNYMHGIGLDEDVRAWFDERVPKPRVGRNFIAKALSDRSAY
ncbi:B12-binding domain-containing radical SAM protein [Quatrionicoccus australiensis]|uniref:B12-binding domain-containing radical SAM protein n=1 Tax=Quatrionicoccus australiensis TaxID=138118 RepID=UPI001CF976D3|nr:radical SAM protein [Quatrionicoccus australiensis]MCB4361565.1 radical SAM protein [Quatrionicoccus australiensis]